MSKEPEVIEEVGLEEAGEKTFVASQWQLIWWRFRKHKLAMFAGSMLIVLYLLAIFCEFLAPYNPSEIHSKFTGVPPMGIHLTHRDQDGLHISLHTYGLTGSRGASYVRTYETNRDSIVPLGFLVRGESYKFWGLWKTERHLFGTEDPDQVFFLFGTDELGRDLLSRILYGSRISLSIGLVGVLLSFSLGITLGGISGYYGGTADLIIQRFIEILNSIPTLPLWMGLSAALPAHWPIIWVYFGMVSILSLLGWTGTARVVRGKFLALREEEFVLAAIFSGAKSSRIMFRHMLPSFASHLIASLTLAIPGMILGETALSFLGIGLRAPAISWGVLLQGSQNVSTLVLRPWLLLPVAFVMITVLMFNFFGDGLRDAADPYGK
jgi:peptide/nickel transport system permease protein